MKGGSRQQGWVRGWEDRPCKGRPSVSLFFLFLSLSHTRTRAGGNNYQALRAVWDEMKDGINLWLNGQPTDVPAAGPSPYSPYPDPHGYAGGAGSGLGLGKTAGMRSQSQANFAGGAGAGAAAAGPSHQPGQPPPPGLSAAAREGLTAGAVQRAVAALEAAALKGPAYISQVRGCNGPQPRS